MKFNIQEFKLYSTQTETTVNTDTVYQRSLSLFSYKAHLVAQINVNLPYPGIIN
jgi:hypothetical protein